MAEKHPQPGWQTPEEKRPLDECLVQKDTEKCPLDEPAQKTAQDETPFLLKTEAEKCQKFPRLKEEADRQHRQVFLTLKAKIEQKHLEELRRETFRQYVGVKTWRGNIQACLIYTLMMVMVCVSIFGGVGMFFFNIALGEDFLFMPSTIKPPSHQPLMAGSHSQGPIAPAPQCPDEENTHRFDCYPEVISTKEKCEARGCCWKLPDSSNGVPYCYFPPSYPSYSLGQVKDTPMGATAVLTKNGTGPYPKDVQKLTMDLRFEAEGRLHLVLNDTANRRYEVPIETPTATTKAASQLYEVEYSHNPFGIVVKRKSNGRVLLNTTVAPLIYADQFLEMSTTLPSKNIYGLGEHQGPFRHNMDWVRIPFWARDQPTAAAQEDVTNLYGSHPFYLCVEEDGQAHGVFLLNSNAMEVILQPAPALTWRTIGGIFDFYIFLGPDPNSVIQQYWDVIGRPMMPPYWALGFHLCRWGYNSANRTRDIAQKMRNAGIPQDTQWNDIDYMTNHLDWTYDQQKFAELPELVKDLHDHGQHYIMIVDPGISNTQKAGTYPPYDVGLKRGVFINDSNGNPIVGRVWPGDTTFPDFTNPITQQWWIEMAADFHKMVPFDGMWIDMNEPSNFADGSTHGCPDNTLEKPPYTPAVVGGSLMSKTLCASSQQHLSSHYNLHNMFGHFEIIASHNALVSIRGKRPVVISRSTFPSSGRHGGHWLGDNKSAWKDMYYSIPGILNMNLFGIPLVGPDICGFMKDTTEELCLRWQQLGAFYPFSRNHNELKAKSQEPIVWSADTQKAIKSALLTRYSLLPHLYFLFHRANKMGETVARPLFFEYPMDSNTWGVDTQFLWGDSLLVTPVLEKGATKVTAYFPNDTWYDFYSGRPVIGVGQNVTLEAPKDTINLHLRGGTILVTQEPATTTTASRKNQFGLVVALNQTLQAWGGLFWDDGDTIDTEEQKAFTMIKFSSSRNTISSQVMMSGYAGTKDMSLGSIRVYGVAQKPHTVMANKQPVDYSYVQDAQMLSLNNLSLPLAKPIQAMWA